MATSIERPVVHDLLPFRVKKNHWGIEIEWDEEVPVQGVVRVLPTRLGENQMISWMRLKIPLLKLIEMYHERGRQLEKALKERDDMETRLSMVEGAKEHSDRQLEGMRSANKKKG